MFKQMKDRVIRIGHSPDPDDAFMFYGLSSGKVKLDGIIIEHLLADIQSLNQRAINGELEVTAISAHAYPFVANHYWIMATGASMGNGYGPVLVSKKYRSLAELKGKKIATPGRLTTATLIFKIFTEGIESVDITYTKHGLNKILDFGELWIEHCGNLPLPLGLDIVRKDLGEDLAHKLSYGLKQSIHFGYTHQAESIPYSLQYGRGINKQLGEKFVKMYVNELTIDMGERGKEAIEKLFQLGAEHNLIPPVSNFQLY
jgi:1,4-dihydroxy-6-naphthoate synthase